MTKLPELNAPVARKLDKSQARAIVSTRTKEQMIEYVQTNDQFLFADYLCQEFNFHNSEKNVDVMEIALDDRAIEMGIF